MLQQMPITFLLLFLSGLVVIPWIFKIIGCGTVVISYFRCYGLFAPKSWSMLLMMLAVPINIINAITEINPILLNFMAFSFLLSRLKKHAVEKKITIITAMDTNIDRLGNSAGEKEEIVNNIKNPPIIVAFKVTRLFESVSKSF